MANPITAGHRTPWHLWAVAILALLWNASGAITIMLAQAGRLTNIDGGEAAYYAAQPVWLVVSTDIALLAAVAAAVALLLRHRAAIWLFGLSLAAIVVNNTYDISSGTSRALVNRGALIVTCIIVVIALLELAYARAMKKRAVLR